MKGKTVQKGVIENQQGEAGKTPSPLQEIVSQGGRAHKVRGMSGRKVDSMIAVYNDRFTYTFMLRNEVASIHFDKQSNKIFFRGHNIRNLELNDAQKGELYNVIDVLASDDEGMGLKDAYQATLTSHLTDNK